MITLRFFSAETLENPVAINVIKKLRLKDLLNAEFKPLVSNFEFRTKLGFDLTSNDVINLNAILRNNYSNLKKSIEGKGSWMNLEPL